MAQTAVRVVELRVAMRLLRVARPLLSKVFAAVTILLVVTKPGEVAVVLVLALLLGQGEGRGLILLSMPQLVTAVVVVVLGQVTFQVRTVARVVALLWVQHQERLAHLLELQHKHHLLVVRATATPAAPVGEARALSIRAAVAAVLV